MSARKRRKKKKSSNRNRSKIRDHSQAGKVLTPPMVSALDQKMSLVSWTNDRLPEMVWAAIVLCAVEREVAFSNFRQIINYVHLHKDNDGIHDLTLSGIAKMQEEDRKAILAILTRNSAIATALSVCRKFERLPAASSWSDYLPEPGENVDALYQAVGSALWHQSEVSTDCRWVRLMGWVAAGKMRMPSEMLDELCRFPEVEDLKRVRPSIRAAEGALDAMDKPSRDWSAAFWEDAWDRTPCIAPAKQTDEEGPQGVRQVLQRVTDVSNSLLKHWHQTHSTTSIDARHDSVFGMSLYALRILFEMAPEVASTGVLGRLGIRTLVELKISLAYLLKKDEAQLWSKWRAYGAGQAKLALLKIIENDEFSEFIESGDLEVIANEDFWEEFVSMNLGNWIGKDLRKLSVDAGAKDTYDKYYGWTSGYAHASWGAVRESCFFTCANPLHRLHRYLEPKVLASALSEACELVDSILDDLHAAYPDFEDRIGQPVTDKAA